MNNEKEEIVKEEKQKYLVSNLLLIERTEKLKPYRFTILAQEEKGFANREFIINCGRYDTRIITINSAGCMEFRNDGVLYLRGNDDFRKKETYQDVSNEWYPFYKRALEEYGFTIITSREQIKNYLYKEPTEVKEEKEVDMKLQFDTPSDEEIEKMISLVDLDIFTKIIQTRVYEESGTSDLKDITKTWAKKWLRKWALAKYRFYKLFDNKLWIEKQIDYIETPDEMEIKINELKAKMPLYKPTFDCIATIDFINNVYKSSNSTSIFKNDARVKDGMTLTHLFALYNNPELDIEVSKLYQSKGKTNIRISINPIDYLTVSINNSGWRSCHNFFDGECRNAGLSYMLDNCTIVSYGFNSEVEYNFYRKFKWNTKKWREMIYYSDKNSSIIFSRQYPYDSDNFSKAVRELLEDKVSEHFNVENKWNLVKSEFEYLEVESGSDLFYNDCQRGFNYFNVINKSDKNKEYHTCKIGSQVMRLSDEDYEIERSDDKIWN